MANPISRQSSLGLQCFRSSSSPSKGQDQDATFCEAGWLLPKPQDPHAACCAQEASLDAYEAMPISSFGEAMLRGMGWKEGMSVGRNVPKEVSTPGTVAAVQWQRLQK